MTETTRFQHWAALAAFSVVSLASLTNSFEADMEWERKHKWAVSVCSISLILSAMAFFMNLFMKDMPIFMKDMHTNMHMENVSVSKALRPVFFMFNPVEFRLTK